MMFQMRKTRRQGGMQVVQIGALVLRVVVSAVVLSIWISTQIPWD